MKIDWKARGKNPYFWFGLLGVVMTAMDIKPEMLTDWSMVLKQIQNLLENPFLLGSVIFAVTGVILNPATKGLSDTPTVEGYVKKEKNESENRKE